MKKKKPIRDQWFEMLCSDRELRRWLKAAGVDIQVWEDVEDGTDEKFKAWARRALNAAAKKK